MENNTSQHPVESTSVEIQRNISQIEPFTNLGNSQNSKTNELNALFKSILSSLRAEFQTYYNHSLDETFFDYNERVFVGFLNNAIIRNDFAFRFSTLQEYTIYGVGRPDILIIDDLSKTYFLIEAKKKGNYPANDVVNWLINSSTESLNHVIKTQTLKYYESEKGFYLKDEYTTYLGVIYFEKIVNINDYDKLILSETENQLKNTFYTLYYFDKQISDSKEGLAVYGQLIDANSFPNF